LICRELIILLDFKERDSKGFLRTFNFKAKN